MDEQKSTFTSLQRVKMCQLYAPKKIKIKPEIIFYQNNRKVSKQTPSKNYKNWELIFYDNSSTDSSKNIFFNYQEKDKRFKYFKSKKIINY